jgi:hypothetical protein
VNDERPFMLAVEDPKDPTNDICRWVGTEHQAHRLSQQAAVGIRLEI